MNVHTHKMIEISFIWYFRPSSSFSDHVCTSLFYLSYAKTTEQPANLRLDISNQKKELWNSAYTRTARVHTKPDLLNHRCDAILHFCSTAIQYEPKLAGFVCISRHTICFEWPCSGFRTIKYFQYHDTLTSYTTSPSGGEILHRLIIL